MIKTAGTGKHKVFLQEKKIGPALLLHLYGGKKHIGCVIIAEPNKKTIVKKFPCHYDHIVAKPIAEARSATQNCRVVCVAGIHLDNATKEDIEKIMKNCKEIEKCISQTKKNQS